MFRKLIAAFSVAIFSQALAAQDLPRAIFRTSEGDITVELYPDRAPATVENFIGLATGTKAYKSHKTGAQVTGTPYFNGTGFHRIIDGFMIQGGDPMGTGMGGPGFKFKNEDSDLTFSKTGRLAMANAGRDTNGSQFFITVAPTPQLDGNYTIFGQVVEGMDVAVKISKMPKAGPNGDQAVNPVIINSLEIVQPGAKAAAVETTGTVAADPKTTTP